MGRSKRQRQRVRFELESVAAKSLCGLLTRTLTVESGCNRVEAEALAIRALEWLPALGAAVVPGQARLSVPATRSKRQARVLRREVLVSAVEVARTPRSGRRSGWLCCSAGGCCAGWTRSAGRVAGRAWPSWPPGRT